MERLIDADRFLKTTRFQEGRYPHKDIVEEIESQPTVDAVEVVRCRDCKHRWTDYCIFHIKGEPADEELLRKLNNDFCSYGERKDDD